MLPIHLLASFFCLEFFFFTPSAPSSFLHYMFQFHHFPARKFSPSPSLYFLPACLGVGDAAVFTSRGRARLANGHVMWSNARPVRREPWSLAQCSQTDTEKEGNLVQASQHVPRAKPEMESGGTVMGLLMALANKCNL